MRCVTVVAPVLPTRPSALVSLAAFLDHSAGQQNRLNSGLFIISNWPYPATLSFGEIWSCRPVTVAIHSMHIQFNDRASFVVWRSSETSVVQCSDTCSTRRSYTAAASSSINNQKKSLPNLLPWIFIDFTNDYLPTYDSRMIYRHSYSLLQCFLFTIFKLRPANSWKLNPHSKLYYKILGKKVCIILQMLW